MWFSQFKNKWWAKREESLKREFHEREQLLIKELKETEELIENRRNDLYAEKESLNRISKENELYEKLVQDRRVDLEKSNQELKDQIRMIEAKASPDNVWVTAFTAGFSKAWDMMLPMMKDGFDRMKDKIKNDAIEQTMNGINKDVDKEVQKKLGQISDVNLKTSNEIKAKIKELEERSTFTEDKVELVQIKNYINALNWILNDYKKD